MDLGRRRLLVGGLTAGGGFRLGLPALGLATGSSDQAAA